MLKEAVFHRPKLNWAYAYDEETVHIRIRTKRGDIPRVEAIIGDKYAWEETRMVVPMALLVSDRMFDYWEAEIKPPFRRLAYYFRLTANDEACWLSEKGFLAAEPAQPSAGFEFPYIHVADLFQPPAWVKDAVFYQIFLDRFANGDPANDPDGVLPWGGQPDARNVFGGDLQGVIDHFSHLEQLGVTAIYFTPVFEAASNHKYDTGDYLRIDRHFGANETMKTLVEACHSRGIRVLLDAVFNHCGGTFPPFVNLMEKGGESPYADWFYVHSFPPRVEGKRPTYAAFAFEPHMPKLRTEHPEVQNYLLEVARYWMEEIGIDGWRLDVADEVHHQFWRKFRDTVKTINPEAYILGEIWHDSIMWLQGDQFDAAMNYPFMHTVLDFFTTDQMDGEQFADAISALLANYPRQANEAAFNLLGSHDTARLLTQCGGNKSMMKLALLFQFTYPGTPCIYYGDEVGMTGGQDPDCRKCMIWEPEEQDHELFKYYRFLIHMRKSYSAWRSTKIRFMRQMPGDRFVAYERLHGDERWIFILNASPKRSAITLSLPCGSWLHFETKKVFSGKIHLNLDGYGYHMLQIAGISS